MKTKEGERRGKEGSFRSNGRIGVTIPYGYFCLIDPHPSPFIHSVILPSSFFSFSSPSSFILHLSLSLSLSLSLDHIYTLIPYLMF